jgi:hypothetical protein
MNLTPKLFFAPNTSAARPDLQAPALPSRLKVFNWGENQSTKGTYRAGNKTAYALTDSQAAQGFERVAIDFDHCTVKGSPANKALLSAGHPPLVFGYGRVNPVVGDGIYLEDIEWTPLGVQHARNFSDLSPALLDDNGEVIFIHSVALTPNGAIHDLPTFLSQISVETLSALTPRRIRQADGIIDMAAIFDRENAAALALLAADTSALDAVTVSKASAPDSVLLIPWGAQPDPLGYLEVNVESLATLPKVQAAMDLLRVPIFDPGDPTRQENSEAAVEEPFQIGSGRVAVRNKDGLYLLDIEWTDDGRKALSEFGYFNPTVWLTGDLADGSKNIVGVKSVMMSTTPNSFTMLELPKLVNLSAMAQNAGYNRLARAMNAEGVASATTDRVKFIKLFAANGKFPRHENGTLITEHEMRVLDIEALQMLYNRTPVEPPNAPNDREKIIRTFSALGKFPKKPNGQVCTVEDLKAFDLKFLKTLYANIVNRH